MLALPLFAQLHGQCVIIVLSSQEDVDNYPSQCTQPGTVHITGNDITNLDALSVITRVTGRLMILGGAFEDLQGLHNLEEVGDELAISTPHLKSLHGLESLITVGGALGIGGDSLSSLAGLSSLQSVGGIFSLGDGLYEDCTGLESLQEVGGMFISSYEHLKRLDGLNNLNVVHNNLTITNMSDLESIEGLSGLESVHNLSITSNYDLPCLTGLDNLHTITGNLEISSNYGMLSLTGLEGVTNFSGEIIISENGSLSICNLPSICSMLNQASSIELYTNGEACNDAATIQSSCINYGQCPANIILRKQPQIDMFWAIYPNCANIAGDLTIDHSQLSDVIVNNVNGLSLVKSIGNNLNLYELELTDLSGLNQLESVGNDVSLSFLTNLQSLSGLESLRSVGGMLSIRSNLQLQNLHGLENLEHLGGLSLNYTGVESLAGVEGIDSLELGLNIYQNYNLLSLASMQNLAYALSVGIKENHALTSLNGLEGLRVISEHLGIGNNDLLQSLQGLGNIEQIGATLSIFENNSLVDLNGLENLADIGGDLYIVENPVLLSLTGLNDSYFLTNGTINIYSNDLLSECAVWPVCNHFAAGHVGVIEDNNGGSCADEEDTLDVCNQIHSVARGKAYVDVNCNGSYEITDIPINNFLIRYADHSPFAVTNESGTYHRLVAPQATTIITANPYAGYSLSPTQHEIVTSSDIMVYDGLDFALCAQTFFNNLQVELTPLTPPRPGFRNSYQICYQNIGSIPQDATISFSLNQLPNVGDVTIINADGGQVSGYEIEWFDNNLPIFTTICRTVTVELSPTVPLGHVFSLTATITATPSASDIDHLDNVSTFDQEVVGSYDPNDKTVFPAQIPTNQLNDSFELEYLIRFQNTGTFPATFIEVIDTILPPLDISTIRVMAASHDYNLTFPEEGVVSWFFQNINLPDSTSNERESHGFIKFKIRVSGDLMLGDIVSNRAGIYFDYNEPVITNLSQAEVVLPTSVSEITNNKALSVIPNPANGLTLIRLESNQDGNATARLFNEHGEILTEFELPKEGAYLSVSNYPPGVYFIKVKKENALIVAKLVIMH